AQVVDHFRTTSRHARMRKAALRRTEDYQAGPIMRRFMQDLGVLSVDDEVAAPVAAGAAGGFTHNPYHPAACAGATRTDQFPAHQPRPTQGADAPGRLVEPHREPAAYARVDRRMETVDRPRSL